MIYLTEFILVFPVSLLMALWQKHLIKSQRKIDHVLWALVYLAIVAAGAYLRRDNLPLLHQAAAFIAACCVLRLPVFNIILNWVRRLPYNYTSLSSTSLMDKIERRVFGERWWLLDAACILIFVALQFFI